MGVLALLAPATARQPDAFGHLLQALALALDPGGELAVVWPEGGEKDSAGPLLEAFHSHYRPRHVLAGGPTGSRTPALLRGREDVDGEPAAYLCRDFSCRAPVTEGASLATLLDGDGA
jgi:uncharacterized protein YyaL (SSP411 family)